MNYKNPFSQTSMDSLLKSEILIGVSGCLLESPLNFNQHGNKSDAILQSLAKNFVLRPYQIENNSDAFEQTLQESSQAFGHRLNHDVNRSSNISSSLQADTEVFSRLSGLIVKSGSVHDDIISMLGDFRSGQSNEPENKDSNSKLEGLIPVAKMEQLSDPELKENFIQRVCIMHCWQQLIANEDRSIYPLIRFHQRHSHIYQSHHPEKTQAIKALLGCKDSLDISDIYNKYIDMVMDVLVSPCSRHNHVAILRQLLNTVEPYLEIQEQIDILQSIRLFESGEGSIKLPMMLIRQQATKHSLPEMMRSMYLFPYPQQALFMEDSNVAIAV